MLFQTIQQVRGKAKVALHEVFRVLRAIHPSQMEHEVCLLAVLIQFLRSRAQVILVDFIDVQFRAGLVLTVPDIFQVIHKGGSHHTLGACD